MYYIDLKSIVLLKYVYTDRQRRYVGTYALPINKIA